MHRDGGMHAPPFLAKPFRLDTFLQTVAWAAAAPNLAPTGLPLTVITMDQNGRIHYANEDARVLFATMLAGGPLRRMQDVMAFDPAADLADATGQWYEGHARALEPERWWIRVRPTAQATTHLLVMVPDGAEYFLSDPVLRLLLDLPLTTTRQWLLSGPALLMDDDPHGRRQWWSINWG